MLRSFGLSFEGTNAGDILLSQEASEKCPALIGTISVFLSNSGVVLDKSLIDGSVESRGAAPQLTTLEALSILQNEALAIAKKHDLDLEQAAQSAALATAFIVLECAKKIGLETGFNLAAYSFIEGSKTTPPPINVRNGNATTRKPWYKFW